MDRPDKWIHHKDRHNNGFCVQCNTKNNNGKQYCDNCLSDRSGTKAAKRQQYLASGLCGNCGKRLLANNKKRCIVCIHKHNRWYASSPTKRRNALKNKQLKEIVVTHYGGRCSCCGESERTFLAVDHKDGGGNTHRQQIRKASSMSFYKWIIDNNYPDYLQILCHNCNISKHLLGECAHKKGAK